MSDTMDKQSEAYLRMLPRLQKDYGLSWIVMVNQRVKAHFDDFEKAASFAIENYPNSDFLIRHTSERPAEFTYIAVDD
ncbi:MAG: hypothetical protein ACHP84_13935 [Caulobacterales bacterium]